MLSKYHLYQCVLWVCIFILCSLLSCSNPSSSSSNKGDLYIKLLDAPANYQYFNISVEYVWIHRSGALANIEWTNASEKLVKVDLLSLRNGKSEPLVQGSVPAGSYDQIKLRFGPCTVKEYDKSESLLNLSKFEYVLNYPFDVQQGKQAQLTFDFNVSESVHKNGLSYSFTPSIRVQNTLFSGSILGSVVDTNHAVVPTTIFTWAEGGDTISTLNDIINGSFQLSDLPENLYSVSIVPFDTIAFHEKRIDNVAVKKQTFNNLGVIVLE